LIIKEIHKDWGLEVIISSEEIFQQPINFWRDLIYKKKLIVFKKVFFEKEEYIRFCMRFGKIWTKKEYDYSLELSEPLVVNRKLFYISPFSNLLVSKIGNKEMPWHADIPNRSFSPFPFRSLWITKNPNPELSGRTYWLDLELGMNYLDKDMMDLAERTRVVQQSWYAKGTDIQEFPLIKTHPITGKKSLRLNYFVKQENKSSEDAWIVGVKIDGVLQEDCSLIKEYLEYLSCKEELIYEHVWDTFDIIIYDNWPFVHKRSKIIVNSAEERLFYRVNINHCSHEEWDQYSKTIS
jgi:alpha-ketoglutarate-dependent taurine dioxygenase